MGAEIPSDDFGLLGVGLIAYDGRIRSDIKDNSINDHLIGVAGVALDESRMQLSINNNVINGAGARDLAGMLTRTELSGNDFGALGIGLIAAGDSRLDETEIKGNTVNDHLVGVGALSQGGSRLEVDVKGGNVISNSLIGVAGLAMNDGKLRMNIKDNVIVGGLEAGFPTGAGVLLNSYDESRIQASVKNNQIADSAGMGVWATAGASLGGTESGSPSGIELDVVGNDISGHGLMGVLAEGSGNARVYMTLKQNTIVSNNVSGNLPGSVSSVMAAMAHDNSLVDVKVKDNISDGNFDFFEDPGATAASSGNGNLLEDLINPAYLDFVGVPPILPFQ